DEPFVGSRALWKTEGFRELFVTFAEPGGIGMSSIVGFLAPVKRTSPYGRRVVFGRRDSAPTLVMAPIAPGLIEPVGIQRVETIDLGMPMQLTVSTGSIALDGEREITFSAVDSISVMLRNAAFRTIDIAACMAHAAAQGSFVGQVGKQENRQ